MCLTPRQGLMIIAIFLFQNVLHTFVTTHLTNIGCFSTRVIEPSKITRSKKIGKITPKYITPHYTGKNKLKNEKFDLITCFNALHHIPNVEFVLNTLVNSLKKGGFLLTKEPVISMGDWTRKRQGLTQNERGIPEEFLETI